MFDAIHQSTLNMALRCGEQFRRRYIEGEIIPSSIAASRGTALHKANEVNLKQKIATRVDLPVSDMLDAARDAYVANLRAGVFLAKEDVPRKNELLNEGLKQTLTLTGLYAQAVAPKIVPIEIEREFSIDVGLEWPLAGRIDHEQDGVVNDLKTAGKSWSEGKINSELQPVFYSLAHEREFGVRPKFVYNILVALKTPKHQIQERTCTDTDYTALMAKLAVFIKMVKAGVFLPADPTSWACSPKWCGYHSTCPYVGNQPAKAWV
jgi:hypothetical protein